MHITHVIAGLGRDGGGTAGYVAGLIEAQCAQTNLEVSLLSAPIGGAQIQLPERCKRPNIPVYSRLRTFLQRPFSKALRELHARKPINIVHCHGLWLSCNHEAIITAESLGIPVLLATHGMLQAEALKVSHLKKAIAMRLYQWSDLQKVSFLMATATSEADSIRALGLSQPIILSPPGLDLPERELMADFSKDRPKRRALLLTRITPIKNIEALLKAWSQTVSNDWELIIAGPDERGYSEVITDVIKEMGLGGSVTLKKAVFGDEKTQLFQSASLFILPSLSENFGIVVAEALSYGLPVLTTTGTPWKSLEEKNCGWWVDSNAASLQKSLDIILSLDNATLAELGARGRHFIENQFQWSAISSELMNAYSWILGARPQPESIHKYDGHQ